MLPAGGPICMALQVEQFVLGQVLQSRAHHGEGLGIAQKQHPTA